jgi:hypothetical protein
VAVVVELGKTIDKRPHLRIIGVEDMRSVLVDLNALDFLAVAVAANVAAAINEQHRLASIGHAARKYAAKQACSDDEVGRHGVDDFLEQCIGFWARILRIGFWAGKVNFIVIVFPIDTPESC